LKKDFTKRAGQIYALGIQHGFTPEEIMKHLNDSFLVLYSDKKQKEIKELAYK
jgi:hypothetical protein